jgi:CRISPR/Cas system CSM-associated protein Csm3 (group 7 of RAMP superfamily)
LSKPHKKTFASASKKKAKEKAAALRPTKMLLSAIEPEKEVRAILSFALITQAPLHVGSGRTDAFSQRRMQNRVREGLPAGAAYDAVCLDANQKPYIPASSLRGLFSGFVSESERILFGYAAGESRDKSLAGALRFSDAKLVRPPQESEELAYPAGHDSPDRITGVRHGVAINPVTGAVQDHFLFRKEIVPERSLFNFDVTCIKILPTQIQPLVGTFKNPRDVWLGAGRSYGFGAAHLWLAKIMILQESDLVAWLHKEDESNWADSAKAFSDDVTQNSDAIVLPKGFELSLNIKGLIMTCEPGLAKNKNINNELFIQCNASGRVTVPGRSLKGLFRSRARKIAASIAHLSHSVEPGPALEIADGLVNQLFGSTERQAALFVGEGTVTGGSQIARPHIAVDRFTGGVKDGALFNVNAHEGGVLKAAMHWISRRLPLDDFPLDALRGLLLLVLRDASDGALRIGWGKNRGYGHLELILKGPDRTKQLGGLCQSISELTGGEGATLEGGTGWVRALHEYIEVKKNRSAL